MIIIHRFSPKKQKIPLAGYFLEVYYYFCEQQIKNSIIYLTLQAPRLAGICFSKNSISHCRELSGDRRYGTSAVDVAGMKCPERINAKRPSPDILKKLTSVFKKQLSRTYRPNIGNRKNRPDYIIFLKETKKGEAN